MPYDSLKSLVDELVIKVEDQGNGTNMLESEYFESLQLDPATLDIEHNERDVFVGYDFVNHRILFDLTKLPDLKLRIPAFLLGFFRHLSCVKDWVFSEDATESLTLEKREAEKFSHEIIQRMLEIGIDPR